MLVLVAMLVFSEEWKQLTVEEFWVWKGTVWNFHFSVVVPSA